MCAFVFGAGRSWLSAMISLPAHARARQQPSGPAASPSPAVEHEHGAVSRFTLVAVESVQLRAASRSRLSALIYLHMYLRARLRVDFFATPPVNKDAQEFIHRVPC